jgi:hypothetical protein
MYLLSCTPLSLEHHHEHKIEVLAIAELVVMQHTFASESECLIDVDRTWVTCQDAERNLVQV